MKELYELRNYISNYNARLLAVSKTKSKETILEAIKCDQHLFGENRVNEIIDKKDVFKDQELHLIGHLQSNKIKQVLPYVNCIESIDSLKIVKLIDKNLDRNLDVLLQLKTGKEDSKTGFSSIDDLYEVYEYIKESKFITVKGIMTISTNTNERNIIENCFNEAYKVYSELKKYDNNIDTLSMGMSNDYKIALDCGSTLIRVGSLIFGNRV